MKGALPQQTPSFWRVMTSTTVLGQVTLIATTLAVTNLVILANLESEVTRWQAVQMFILPAVFGAFSQAQCYRRATDKLAGDPTVVQISVER